MFSPQHSEQTPAVGTDSQVHVLFACTVYAHVPDACVPNTDPAVTCVGGGVQKQLIKER